MSETEETRDMTVTDEPWTSELEELPPRPRRKLLTPLSGVLLAVLIAAGGFIGGVLVEKGQTGGGQSNGFAAAPSRLAGAANGGAGAPFGGRGGGQGTPIVGKVSSEEGRILYVTTPQGGTVRVRVPVGESVSKTITTSVHSIHPGENVVVQGSKGKGGAVNATSVTATPASSTGSSGGGAVLSQLFGGGGK
jgi:hypothetical protein